MYRVKQRRPSKKIQAGKFFFHSGHIPENILTVNILQSITYLFIKFECIIIK